MAAETREQRLVMRVLAYWRSLAGGNSLPRRSRIDPHELGEDWHHCLMVDVDPVLDRSRLAHVGDRLRDPGWPTFERQRISECLDGSLLKLATSYIGRVIAERTPVSMSGIASHLDSRILYRSILLPISEEGGIVDGVFGAANYRDVEAREEIHPLAAAG